MFLLEKLYGIKKWIIKSYKKYLTIEGKYTCILPDKMYLKKVFYHKKGTHINLKNPVTFTEKINWLKLYDRNPQYTIMADKYASRAFVSQRVGDKYPVPLLGVWDSPADMNFDDLPNQFVLKCNHDNGVIICKDKGKLDIEKVKAELAARLERDYSRKYREWSYRDIPRKIICEKFMSNTGNDPEIEYNIFCFNGTPKFIKVGSGKEEGVLKKDFYDMDWNHLDLSTGEMAGDVFLKPPFYDEMVNVAKVLSKDVPHVRVDFYCWDGVLYTGELTFYSAGGFMKFNPEKWDDILGSWLELPKKRRRKK